MNESQMALYNRIRKFRFDEGEVELRFVDRLARENGWSAEFASRVIDEYRQGTVPLVVPLKLIEHHFRRHPDDYIALQVYLNPHPAELGLRNHL